MLPSRFMPSVQVIPLPGSETIDVPFNVTIEEGRHYTLGSIILPSGAPLTMAEINKAAGLVTNKVETSLSVREDSLFEQPAFVMGQYKTKGYMDCVVTPHPQYDEAAAS